jgi:tetratricopeptide (TPR) repeat protein
VFKNLFAYLVIVLLLASCAATPAGNYNNEQGIAIAAEKKWEEALKFFQKADLENPENAQIYNNIGWMYYKLDDFENSSKFLKKAMDLDPKYIAPRNNILALYQDKGRLGELVEYYESRVAKKPNDVIQIMELSIIYFKEERFKDAIRLLSKGHIIAPKEVAFENGLNIAKEMDIGVAKYNDGDYTEALKAFENARKLLKPKTDFVVEKHINLARSKLKKKAD